MPFIASAFRRTCGLLAIITLVAGASPAVADFQAFVAGLRPEAEAAGVSRTTFDRAFRDVTPDPSIIALTKKQAEFVKPIWSYLDGAISAERISRGTAKAREWNEALVAAERRTGVDRRIILGIWGIETNFGSYTGDKDVIRSLATLAYAGYRDGFFRDELVAALRILEERKVARAGMRGSWAGAMGQTQFMPTSYQKFAVDGDDDGRVDIWSSVDDALASTGNYLKAFGWRAGLPWGFEVSLPEAFDLKLADRSQPRSFAEWRRLGLARTDGRPLPSDGEAAIYLPAGARGPSFLVTSNFAVIRKYNNSDSYALAVAHLGDRLYGGSPLAAAWPRGDRSLSRGQSIELQKRLAALGYAIEKIDGKLGEKSREAIRAYQLASGLKPDGYPSVTLLTRLKTAQR